MGDLAKSPSEAAQRVAFSLSLREWRPQPGDRGDGPAVDPAETHRASRIPEDREFGMLTGGRPASRA